jgi:hypothetical protein
MHHPPANNPEDEQPRLFELTDEQREYVQEVIAWVRETCTATGRDGAPYRIDYAVSGIDSDLEIRQATASRLYDLAFADWKP